MKKIIIIFTLIILTINTAACSKPSTGLLVKEATPPTSDFIVEDITYEKDFSNMSDFYSSFSDAFMTSTTGENCIVSPVNTYMTLAIAAQCNAENKDELISALKIDSMETVQNQCDYLCSLFQRENQYSQCSITSSVWINEKVRLKDIGDISILTDKFHTSVYKGGSNIDLNTAASQWINDVAHNDSNMTNAEPISDKYDFTVLSSLEFSKTWYKEFKPEKNTEDIFTTADDTKINCTFMNRQYIGSCTIEPNLFTATALYLKEPTNYNSSKCNEYVLLLLPAEGVTVEEMLNHPTTKQFLCDAKSFSALSCDITMSIPKLDITTKTDYQSGLPNMGIQENESIAGSSTIHFIMDENGCHSTTIDTYSMNVASANQTKPIPINFICNRPYAFALVSDANDQAMPIIVGKVNNPIK